MNIASRQGDDRFMRMDFSAYKGMQVLVTGATGFTGLVLTRRLVEAGANVRAIARPESKRRELEDLPIRWIIGQVYDAEVVRQATEGIEIIFHMATTYRHAGAPEDENRLVHITSTQLLAKAVTGQPQFKRFAHISTVGVHGDIKHGIANEDSPFQPGDIYQVTKAEAEQWIRAYAAEHGLPLTILRPCGIYGPGEKRFFKLFKMANRRTLFLLGKTGHGIHLIHVEDLTRMIMLASIHPAGLNETFICGTPSNISLERMAEIIARELGHSIKVIRLPALPFYIAGFLCELLYKPLRKDPPLHRRRVGFFTKTRSFDTSRIRNRLAYTCQYPDDIGLAQVTRWYVEHGWIKPQSFHKS